jgi:AcrR family transcriptional regulator
MTKEERRRQLLDTALAIVREEGTEALTLARVAERAGVSKPIAYEHFGTRGGLLIALFRDYDDRTGQAVRAALAAGGKTLEDAASVLSAAYVDCFLSMGPEMSAILDALSASEETSDFRHSFREFLVEEFRETFAPFVPLSGQAGKATLLGVLGAAEALAEEAVRGAMSRGEAVAGLTRIMLGALNPAALAPAAER